MCCRLGRLRGDRSAPLQAAPLSAANLPVIPVEPGNSSIFSDSRRFGRENGKVNQALARQFP
jgi:hypothetical protein